MAISLISPCPLSFANSLNSPCLNIKRSYCVRSANKSQTLSFFGKNIHSISSCTSHKYKPLYCISNSTNNNSPLESLIPDLPPPERVTDDDGYVIMKEDDFLNLVDLWELYRRWAYTKGKKAKKARFEYFQASAHFIRMLNGYGSRNDFVLDDLCDYSEEEKGYLYALSKENPERMAYMKKVSDPLPEGYVYRRQCELRWVLCSDGHYPTDFLED